MRIQLSVIDEDLCRRQRLFVNIWNVGLYDWSKRDWIALGLQASLADKPDRTAKTALVDSTLLPFCLITPS